MSVLEQHGVAEVRARAFAGGTHGLLIDGGWEPAASNRTFDSVDPATGQHLATVAMAEVEDLDRAVLAARRALEGPWSATSPAERQRLIWRLGDLMEAHADELAVLETLDNGKPLRDARTLDIPHAVNVVRYYAGWATKLTGDTVPVSGPGELFAYTVREPVGVVGQIVPWNAPLMMAAAKIAPALAAGCTVVLKPAEQTPLTALRLGHLVQEAGFPPGVVNILTGFGEPLGAAMVTHPGIDKITFTGSTEVGRSIVRGSAADFKRVTLELGGKTPVIILPDADLERAIPGVARGIFANTGQVCNAGSRLFAHPAVFEQVVEGVVRHAESLRVGPGLSPDTQMGPVISQIQLDRVRGYVASGQADGAQLRTGGNTPGGGAGSPGGFFIAPTVLTGTTTVMRVAREEIFGPVLCAMSLEGDSLDEAAAEANATSYGLGAAVWTRDLGAAHRLARRLKAGTVRVNGGGGLDAALPFGGFKQSGWGRESGREGIEAFTELKSVSITL